MKNITKKILFKCGIQAHLTGFLYLGDAIESVIEDKSKVYAITKILYPEIAKRHDTKWTRVERAIRHAIEQAFDRLTPNEIEDIFENSLDPMRGKPTNAQFIATIAELYGDEIRAGA